MWLDQNMLWFGFPVPAIREHKNKTTPMLQLDSSLLHARAGTLIR